MATRPLKPCPSRPNCVSSQATRRRQKVEPLSYSGDHTAAWRVALMAVAHLPRARVIETSDGWLLAECQGPVGTTSELELVIDVGERVIHVRSASRKGWWDLGINRRRVEALRRTFNAHFGTPGSQLPRI